MFFDTEPPHSWSFHHNAGPRNLDGGMEEPRPRPARPKFHSFDALRPGLFAPRPFQQHRERRTSDGSGCYTSEEDGHVSDARSQASSTSSETDYRPAAHKERIIPITLERDDERATVAPPAPQRPARKLSRKDAEDGAATAMQDISEEKTQGDDVKEESERDMRAQSCPVSAPLPPLNVDAAMAAQQRSASQPPQNPAPYGKPNYLNSSPKPFSPGAKPFHSANFGVFKPVSRRPSQTQETESVSIPVQIETAQPVPTNDKSTTEALPRRQPPKVAPKPKTTVAPKVDEASSVESVKTARQMALEKILAVHQEVNPLADQLESFSGSRGDKKYLFLDEMLTRQLLRLDDVEANGDVDVRNSRKEAIKRIQDSLATLEKKCSRNQKNMKAESTEAVCSDPDVAAHITASATSDLQTEESGTHMELNPSARDLGHIEPAVANTTGTEGHAPVGLQNGETQGKLSESAVGGAAKTDEVQR